MSKINYDGRIFRSVANSATGEVSAATTFYYHQKNEVVWAEYAGGAIVFGNLIAKIIDETGALEMRYQHLNQNGELMTGKCFSVPELTRDGKLRLHEHWEWTSGDFSKGESVIEEVFG